jgi:putative hydrolase of the HAD superfamily
MIHAVLWDFGGVISESPFDAFGRYEREQRLPSGFLRRLNATNPDENAWAKMERGDVSVEEFCRLFGEEARAAGHEVVAQDVLALLSGAIRPAMVEAIRRCRPRCRTALLTNNFVGFADGADRPTELGEILALFDVVIESSQAGVRKPDPRFYRLACDALQIEPSSAVFLDDLGVNLKPARAMGMTTIKVTDPDTALAELEAVLGFPVR